MHNGSVSGRYVALGAILGFAMLAALPAHASAQTNIQTQELLPQGQNTCQAITVTDIEPHVYSGVLESFDVTISNTSDSYVGILASVGNTSIPLNYITRWAGTPSGLRIHVDTPSISNNGNVPVTLTLLASPSGQPTCAAIVSFTVAGSQAVAVNSTPATTSTSGSGPVSTGSTSGTQATSKPTAVASGAANTGGVGAKSGSASVSNTQSTSSSSTLALGAGVVSASNAKFFSNICTGNNAYRLWFLLLALYVILVAVMVFAEPWFLETSVISSTAVILVPLILLLLFWYFSETCRAASWIPVIACVIAIVGLFLAFREYEMPPLLPAASSGPQA